MVRDFAEEFSDLINPTIPRMHLRIPETSGADLNEGDYGCSLEDYDMLFPLPEDGFIVQFCEKK